MTKKITRIPLTSENFDELAYQNISELNAKISDAWDHADRKLGGYSITVLVASKLAARELRLNKTAGFLNKITAVEIVSKLCLAGVIGYNLYRAHRDRERVKNLTLDPYEHPEAYVVAQTFCDQLNDVNSDHLHNETRKRKLEELRFVYESAMSVYFLHCLGIDNPESSCGFTQQWRDRTERDLKNAAHN